MKAQKLDASFKAWVPGLQNQSRNILELLLNHALCGIDLASQRIIG